MSFKNEYLSYSRLALFEQCPKAFEFRYVQKAPSQTVDHLEFGSLVHATLEEHLKALVARQSVGRLSLTDLQAQFRTQWAASDLVGMEWFREGDAVLAKYVEVFPEFDYRQVLGLEWEFNLALGEFVLHGFIDKIEALPDGTLHIVDYKTNRLITSQAELDDNLQLSVYALVARECFPQFQRVRLSHYLLRHGITITTERTNDDLDQVREYVVHLGKQTESAKAYPPKLNPYCSYCDYRHLCPAYQEALTGKQRIVCKNMNDLQAAAAEYEEVSNLAKILYARKEHLADVLKVHLMAEKEVTSPDHVYALGSQTKTEYPRTTETIAALAKFTGVPEATLWPDVTSVEKTKVDALMKVRKKELGPAKMLELEMALEDLADKQTSFRLNVKKIKNRQVVSNVEPEVVRG